MSMKRALIKRHVYLMLASIAVLSSLLIVGFSLSQSMNASGIFDGLPGKNDTSLLLWRFTFYAVCMALWKPLLVYRARKMSQTLTEEKLKRLSTYRVKLAIMMAIYECFIVQNLIGQWIAG